MSAPDTSTSTATALPQGAAAIFSDAAADGSFDRATRLAASALAAPMAVLATGEPDALLVRSRVGFATRGRANPGPPPVCPLSREVARTGGSAAVADLSRHPLGDDYREPRIVGYLGVALRTPGGGVFGALYVMTPEPREWTAADAALLADVAAWVGREVELRATAREASAAEDARLTMLRESEARYRLLFDSNPRPAWVYDVDTLRFLAVNAAAVEAYGWSHDEFLAMTILDIRPGADAERVLERVRTSMGRPALASEWRHCTRDGRTLDVSILSHPVPFGGRRARIVLVDDVTERRRLEAQLREAQKMEAVGRLAGGIAHDFNNLLTAIKGYSQIGILSVDALVHGVDDETARGPYAPSLEEVRHDLVAIKTAADRAAALTAQLLAFSRRQVLQPVVLDLNEVAAALEGMVRRLIGEHIDVRLALGAAAARVKADPSQVEQVILNLVLNARDAMPAGGRLTIETSIEEVRESGDGRTGLVPGTYVVLSVRDSGVGMDEATRSRVFEPFFTTKEVGKGTGLGLSTVYGIVKQSGGEVRLQSAPGEGTTVRVYLPATEEATPEPLRGGDAVAAPDAPTRRAPRQTILVVEDEASVRQLACAALRQAGYEVLGAATPDEARVLADSFEGELALVVADVVMPGQNGPALAADVLRRHPRAGVLYVSGYSEHAIAQHGLLGEGSRFLAKPFTLDELRGRVEELLGRAQGSGPRA